METDNGMGIQHLFLIDNLRFHYKRETNTAPKPPATSEAMVQQHYISNRKKTPLQRTNNKGDSHLAKKSAKALADYPTC